MKSENHKVAENLDSHMNELVEELNEATESKKPELIAAIVATALVQASKEVEDD